MNRLNLAIGKTPNYYEILNLDRDASEEEIDIRFKEICEEHEMISRMDPWLPIDSCILEKAKAYQILSDPKQRIIYNKKIDFDIVVLDKEIDKTELADISYEYKRYCATKYEDLVNKFNNFKKEMNESLWLIKTTSIFLIFDVISSVIFTFMFYEIIRIRNTDLYNSMKPWAFTIFISFIYLQFVLFRYSWQKWKKNKLFKD